MAKPIERIQTPIELPFYYQNQDIQICPSCNITIDRNKHVYLESKVTGKWYCDIVCMVIAEGARWEGDYIRDDFGNLFTIAQWKRDREVIEHG